MKLFILLVVFSLTFGQRHSETNDVNNPKDYPEAGELDPTEENVVNIPNIPYTFQPQYNYAEALAMSMLFYEAQRSGKLPDNQRVKWRGDSAMDDGMDSGYNLTGGYYDGGSYIKYGYTMAFTTTLLSWGVIRYRRAYEILGQLEHALDTIKWATDYFIKCHPSEVEFYGQVSDKPADSQYMGRPENMTYARKSYKITPEDPGSDLASETAAAMAAASIVFYPTMPEYSAELLQHAKQLYIFARQYPGRYSDSISMANQAYASSDYKDDFAWAAVWLYKRTGEIRYLSDAERLIYRNGKLNTLATEFSWGSKQAGLQVLLAETTGKAKYRKVVEMFCDYAQPKPKKKYRTKSRYTRKGLLYINQWGSLRYAANSAFLCAMAADLGYDPDENRDFATKQINYMLGGSGRSFVVGFGENFPRNPYHKSSYCPSWPASCTTFNDEIPNAHILYGALVGGPSKDDSFRDQRSNEKQSSVTIDFNAGFQSALAALLDFYIFGEKKRPKPDLPGVIKVLEATLPPRTVSPTLTPAGDVHDWANLLKKSLLFFEAQRSGPVDKKNRISWRRPSGMADRFKEFDLVGGYYDGPGYVKNGFPLSFSMTMLCWSLIEYEDAYRVAGEYKNALSAVRWGMDYILKTIIYKKLNNNSTLNYIVAQIGDQSNDQLTWDRPERMNTTQNIYLISPDHTGTELTGEMVASLAAASIVFEKEDKQYSNLLYNHSAFIFSSYVRRKDQQPYIAEITQAANEYPSSGYRDEMAWAAAWLNVKRKHQYFHQTAMKYYTSGIPTDFSWDNKTAGVQLLIAIATKKSDDIASFCNWLIDSAPRTNKGMLFLHDKYPAKYAANAAFILLLTFEKFPRHYRATQWRNFGYQQMVYLIGGSGRSYVIGYGPNQPTQPYHKASSCPNSPHSCGFKYKTIDDPNPQKLVGALVGGPDIMDNFEDSRLNQAQSRVSLDGNAGFQGTVAGIFHLKINNLLGNSAVLLSAPSILQLFLCLIIVLYQNVFLDVFVF